MTGGGRNRGNGQAKDKAELHSYEYPRPAVTVDCVIFGYEPRDLQVLLVQRDLPPFEGAWALPGGFVKMDESLDDAARRELAEEASVKDVYLEQLYTFGGVGRDPRGRVITVAYYALVKLSDHQLRAATDARDARWFSVNELPELAFDHRNILDTAQARLRAKVRYEPIGFELLPPQFTLTQLQVLYETLLERDLDKRNFRKKVHKLDVLTDTGEVLKGVAHRAPRLYEFHAQNYQALKAEGFHFEL